MVASPDLPHNPDFVCPWSEPGQRGAQTHELTGVGRGAQIKNACANREHGPITLLVANPDIEILRAIEVVRPQSLARGHEHLRSALVIVRVNGAARNPSSP